MTAEIEKDIRVVKKYPNRRLYDTAISCYITLDDVKALVLEQAIFQVIDAKTGEDITTSTLLQIINEHEDKSQPIFTVSVLQNIIRFQDHHLKYLLKRYLDQSMRFFIMHKTTLEQDVQAMLDVSPSAVVHEIAERNLALWLDLQRQGLQLAAEKEAERVRALEQDV